MGPWWTLIVPFTYAGVMAWRHPGFRKQPHVVLSRDPDSFASRQKSAGGAGAIRTGVLVDVPFALLLCGAIGFLIATFDGAWWLVLPPAALDLLEGLVLWMVVGDEPPTRRGVQTVLGVAVAKFVAYGVAVATLASAAVTSG
jgi:hypothetical protein